MGGMKQSEDPDQEQEQPSAESDSGKILSTEDKPQESGQSDTAQDSAANDDGTGAGAGNDEGNDGQDASVADATSSTAATAANNGDARPVEIASSARADDSGGDGTEEEDEVSGDVPNADDDDDDDDDDGKDNGVSEDQDGEVDQTDNKAKEGNEDKKDEDDDSVSGDDDLKTDDDNVVDEDEATEAVAKEEIGKYEDQSASGAAGKGQKSGEMDAKAELSSGEEGGKDANTNAHEAEAKTINAYADVLRGPHKKNNEVLNKLRGSHDREKATSALPADDENAENASAKERAKGSPELDLEPHNFFGPLPKGQQHHSSFPIKCNVLSLPCHATEAFSSHPLVFVLVVATFVLLLVRRIRHRSRNNANARMDGRGDYAAIELLEGNFDDNMSFTGDDEDPDDIISSWRGDTSDSFIASGVGDDLDDGVVDGKLSLSELNG